MVKPFTEKQENLLTSIVPGLEAETIGCNWMVSFNSDGAVIFDDVHHHDTNFVKLGWRKATKADFNHFVKWGLFDEEERSGRTCHYALNQVAIVEAYKRGFDFPDPSVPSQYVYNIQGNTFSGVTNINSRFEHSTQSIQASSKLGEQEKQTLNNLLMQLQEALVQVSDDEYQSQKNTVAKQAERLAQDVAEPEPDKAGVKISAEGLKKAAENLAKVAPQVLTIAMQIVRHLGY